MGEIAADSTVNDVRHDELSLAHPQMGHARLWVLGHDALWRVTLAGSGAGR
jgi:hypothetical protein